MLTFILMMLGQVNMYVHAALHKTYLSHDKQVLIFVLIIYIIFDNYINCYLITSVPIYRK